MTKTFVTSDTHFGHTNIIKFCQRPFKSVEVMNEAMIERWNKVISPEDTVYFLGDFAMGPMATDDFILKTLKALNGKKSVIIGNHDEPHSKYKRTGIRGIIEDNKLDITVLRDIVDLKYEGTHFVLCHFPMNDWNGKYGGSVHLHGHVHNGYSASKARQQAAKRRYDVGVDMYGGPVELTGDCRFLNEPKGWK